MGQEVRITEYFSHEEVISVDKINRIKDQISDLESAISIEYGYDPALRAIEHKEHLPPHALEDGGSLDDLGLFDEQADLAFAYSRKLILAALVQMGWIEENKSWINIQEIKKDLADA